MAVMRLACLISGSKRWERRFSSHVATVFNFCAHLDRFTMKTLSAEKNVKEDAFNKRIGDISPLQYLYSSGFSKETEVIG